MRRASGREYMAADLSAQLRMTRQAELRTEAKWIVALLNHMTYNSHEFSWRLTGRQHERACDATI